MSMITGVLLQRRYSKNVHEYAVVSLARKTQMIRRTFSYLPPFIWIIGYVLLVAVCSLYIAIYLPILSDSNFRWYVSHERAKKIINTN